MANSRIAFWNVQNLFDTVASKIAADLGFTPEEEWTEDVLEVKLDALGGVINEMFEGNGPELLGLCEVENLGIVERLVDRLDGKFEIAHVESSDVRGIDTSLIYDPDRFELGSEGPKAHVVHLRFATRDIFEVPLVVCENGAEVLVLVNHWPSRRTGRYDSEPYRIAVANHCARIIQEHLKVSRVEYLTLENSRRSLDLLNERWNRNVLLMGDLNDYPYDRSVLTELAAAGGFDRIDRLLKKPRGNDREIPPIASYLRTQPILFNCMWKFLGVPDSGTYFWSEDVNTMNVLDHFIISRGLLHGEDGLIMRPENVDIFRPKSMTTPKGRPRRFKYKKNQVSAPTGVSDHFPICGILETAT